MSPTGSCYQISFKPQNEISEEFLSFLENYFEVIVCNYTKDSLEEYVAYESLSFDEKDFIRKAKNQNIKLLPYKIELLKSENWLKENIIEFPPVETDEFLIYGVYEKEAPKTNKIPIKIYAATAFGSEHQTTRACLDAIAFIKEEKHKKILDMGCGSGILSIAMAKLWKDCEVFAIDIDQEAVWVTEQNAKDNSVEGIVSAEKGDGYASDFVKNHAKYDIITSNILARPLIEMAEDLYQSLNKGGFAIISGFVFDQTDWVLEAHTKLGLRHVKTYEIENWRAALLKKTHE